MCGINGVIFKENIDKATIKQVLSEMNDLKS